MIAALRRLRFTGPEIAELLGWPLSTVSGILTRIGMGRLGRLGLEPAERYERERPGELIHIDVKKLGRIGRRRQSGHRRPAPASAPRAPTRDGRPRRRSAGSTCTSPSTTATRLAYAEVLADEKTTHRHRLPAARGRVLRRHGITVER